MLNTVLQRKVFEDAIVIFHEDFPNAGIWNEFKEYLCVEVFNLNGKLSPGHEHYVDYPIIHGYASCGFNCQSITLFDPEDDLLKSDGFEKEAKNVIHCCDQIVVEKLGLNVMEFIDKTDRRHRVEIPLRKVKKYLCGKCGESLFIDELNPKVIVKTWRDRIATT